MSGKALEGDVVAPNKPTSNGHSDKAASEIMDCFAGDETVTIYLDRLQWVRLKKELDYGEEQQLSTALFVGYSQDELRAAAAQNKQIQLTNSGQFMLTRLAVYIDDWNLLDKRTGTTVRLPRKTDERIAIIKRLSKDAASMLEAKIIELRGEGQTQEASDESPLSLQPTGETTE